MRDGDSPSNRAVPGNSDLASHRSGGCRSVGPVTKQTWIFTVAEEITHTDSCDLIDYLLIFLGGKLK